MKYWYFYGDRWTSKTSHLSLIQAGAYIRLITWCTVHECPLPLNRRDCHKIAHVATRHEAKAVDDVIAEFFDRQDDGWHQKTVDETLERWHASGKDRADREVFLSRARGYSFRERQKEYVQALRDKGLTVSFRTSMAELVRLCAQHGVQTQTVASMGASANGKRYSNGGANAIANKAIANAFAPYGANAVCSPSDDALGPLSRAIKAMEKTGLEGVNPNNSQFVALLQLGALPRLFAVACSEAKAKGKPYAWAMAMALGRVQDGVITLAGDAVRRPVNGSPRDFSGQGGLTDWAALPRASTAEPWDEAPATGPPSPSESDVPF